MLRPQQGGDTSAWAGAIEANLFEFFRHMRSWPRIEVHHDHKWLWTLSDVPDAFLNSVMNVSMSSEEVDAAIESAKTRAQANGVKVLWWVGPSTRPDDLGERLAARGFAYGGNVAGMAVDLHALGPGPARVPDVKIERVRGEEALRRWGRTFATAMNGPDYVADAWGDLYTALDRAGCPLYNYLALRDGQPVAVASMYLGAGVAGIYCVAVIQEARRQGVGFAITKAALNDARAAGYKTGILQSTPAGKGVYRRLGFREYCRIQHYVWTPED